MRYVALLRAINVGGTGKLAMSELAALCAGLGLSQARTYIQSGNVVFASTLSEARVKAKLEQALAKKLGAPVGVLVRSSTEIEAILRRNPFAHAAPNRVIVFFLDRPPARTALHGLVIPGREVVRPLGREVFVHYPDGQGRSKLKLPFAKTATGRNLNTIAKLAALAKALT